MAARATCYRAVVTACTGPCWTCRAAPRSAARRCPAAPPAPTGCGCPSTATSAAPRTPASSRPDPSPWSVALQDLGHPTDFVEDVATRLATVERDAPTGRASAGLHRRSTRSSPACPGVGPGAPVIPQADPPTGTPLPLSDGWGVPSSSSTALVGTMTGGLADITRLLDPPVDSEVLVHDQSAHGDKRRRTRPHFRNAGSVPGSDASVEPALSRECPIFGERQPPDSSRCSQAKRALSSPATSRLLCCSARRSDSPVLGRQRARLGRGPIS
jgi:hypothetical protein